VQDWLKKNPTYKIKPIDLKVFFNDTAFQNIFPEMYRLNKSHIISESAEAKVKRHLIELNTSGADARAKAEKAIRDNMDDQEYRLGLFGLYKLGAQLLLREPDAPLEVKRFIADILAAGIVNDDELSRRYYTARDLSDALAVTGREILSDAALANIQKGFDDPELLGREMIFLAYRAGLDGAPERIAEISREPLVVQHRFNRTVWAALMVRAWSGDAQAIQTILEHIREMDPSFRARFCFTEISTIHHKDCVNFLIYALNSDARMGSGGDYRFKTNPYLIAHHAASALYQMLEGFPEPTGFGFQHDLEQCRDWVKQQTQTALRPALWFGNDTNVMEKQNITFRTAPLTEDQKAMLFENLLF
jgi:hypothetical protein